MIDPTRWANTRMGASAGRGFRYQDAAAAWLATKAWAGQSPWAKTIPEGLDDITLHGHGVDIFAQAKSRHDPKSTFSTNELGRYLAKSVANAGTDSVGKPSVRFALVLERPASDIVPTDWARCLDATDAGFEELKRELSRASGLSPEVCSSLLRRTHIVAEPFPLTRAQRHIEEKSSLVPTASLLVAQLVRQQVGEASDRNFMASATAPESVGATAVQAAVDRVAETVDLRGYLEVTAGLCEVANFHEPLCTPDFYSGVDVAPGHVGAGLVFDRPELVTNILDGLSAKGVAVVAGPSGVGKSAAMWLASYHTRHAVRWYRLRCIRPDDVPRIMAMAKLLDATELRPLGFVADDLGHDHTAGWDALAREVRTVSGVLLLGAVREEDAPTLETLTPSQTVRPRLDEELAERIWRALSHEGATKVSYWRESFEQSRELLLEYTHMLTAGVRLAETVDRQITRRLMERRDDELSILRVVAFAAANGAAIDQSRLRGELAWTSAEMARPLARLVDEHAIRCRDDGSLTGLHELRSIQLDRSVREHLHESVPDLVTITAKTVCTADLALFIVRVLRLWPEVQPVLLDALVARAGRDGPECWAAMIHGLGLATADRIANVWLTIARAAAIDDRVTATAFFMTATELDFRSIPNMERVAEAKEKFLATMTEDLRRAFIDRLRCADEAIAPAEFHQLVAAQLPLRGADGMAIRRFRLSDQFAALPLLSILAICRTVHALDPSYAADIVEMAGGTVDLLGRLHEEIPWITDPMLGTCDEGISVAADIYIVSTEFQTDLNNEVVELCEWMLAATPAADIAISNAVFPDRTPAHVGEITLVSKRIPRRNLPSPAQVSWNRAQIRAVHRLVGSSADTARVQNFASAMADLVAPLEEGADAFCRMEPPSKKLPLLLSIRKILTGLAPLPLVREESTTALELGDFPSSDDAHTFVTGIERLVGELIEPNIDQPHLMAIRISSLIASAEKLAVSDEWRFVEKHPGAAIEHLTGTLHDIRAVIGELAIDATWRRAMANMCRNRSRRHRSLPRAAQVARQRAESRVDRHKREIAVACSAAGIRSEVVARPRKGDRGGSWPSVEYAVLGITDSLSEWVPSLEPFQAVVRAFPDERIIYAPIVHGTVAPFAFITLGGMPVADPNFTREWEPDLPYPIASGELVTHFTTVVDILATLSTIAQSKPSPANKREVTVFEVLNGRLNEEFSWFSKEVTSSGDDVLKEVATILVRWFERVSDELGENSTNSCFAEEIVRAVQGSPSQLALEVASIRIALVDRALARSEATPHPDKPGTGSP